MESSGTEDVEQHLLTRIVEEAPSGVVRIARDGRVIDANREARRILGAREDAREGAPEDARNDAVGGVPDIHRLTDWARGARGEDGTPCAVDGLPFSRVLVTGQPEEPRTIGIPSPDDRVTWVRIRALPSLDLQRRLLTDPIPAATWDPDRRELRQDRDPRRRAAHEWIPS